MCRLAAFPPGFSREEALEILKPFAWGNRDGVGTAHVKNGEFVVVKSPLEMDKALEQGVPLLNHMPYDGWTIAHLRAASHGKAEGKNTHPFVSGDWAFCHNGIWSSYSLARELLELEPEGDTDSEVAAMVWDRFGPKKFRKLVEDGGVYLALNKSGGLWAYITRGDLAMKKLRDKQCLLASRFSPMAGNYDVGSHGWLKFDAKGRFIGGNAKLDKWKDWSRGVSGYLPLREGNLYGYGSSGDAPPRTYVIGEDGVVGTKGDSKVLGGDEPPDDDLPDLEAQADAERKRNGLLWDDAYDA